MFSACHHFVLTNRALATDKGLCNPLSYAPYWLRLCCLDNTTDTSDTSDTSDRTNGCGGMGTRHLDGLIKDAVGIVHSGKLGQVTTAGAWVGVNRGAGHETPAPVPEGLDWNLYATR